MSETTENDSSPQAVASENPRDFDVKRNRTYAQYYEGWNFNSGNYLFTTDTK